MCICMCLHVHICMHVCVCISMGMIIYMCMSICLHMSAFIIKLVNVLIIYLISTYTHSFVFKTYMFISQFDHTLYQPLLLAYN